MVIAAIALRIEWALGILLTNSTVVIKVIYAFIQLINQPSSESIIFYKIAKSDLVSLLRIEPFEIHIITLLLGKTSEHY